jgi:predicted DNA-binding transcriptional regulator YafY
MSRVRADRLVAVLLMLQRQGQVTAAEVATELEVSERTARRDLEALGVAGLPVYPQVGRGGGWRLAGGGRIDLSGLTEDETRALFLVAGTATGTPELRAALRKVVRALPEAFRSQAEAASGAVVVEPAGWGGRTPGPPASAVHLDRVQRAVVTGEQLLLGYRSRQQAVTTRVVHPLGLAAKGRAWYLVADTEAGLRTFRVDRMTAVEGTGLAVNRPEGFDLTAAWQLITEEVEGRRAPLRALARADPAAVGTIRWLLDTRVSIGPVGPDGRVELEVRGSSVRSLAGELAGLGAALDVSEPPELRAALARIGAELVASYGNETGDPGSPGATVTPPGPGR